MIKIIYGNEPYRLDFERQKVVGSIKNPTMNYTPLQGVFTEEVSEACRVFPFFEEKRVVLLDTDTLKDLDTDEFKAYVKNPSRTTDLLVICRNVDTRLKIYKAVKDMAVPCNKVSTPKEFEKCVLYELSKAGAKITAGGLSEFTRRMNYFEREDVNLLTATEYIRSLSSISPEITEDMVKRYVPSYEEVNVFSLSGLIKSHDMDAILKQVNLLNKDRAIPTLSLLLYSFRVAYKEKFYSLSEIGGRQGCFSDCPAEKLAKAINLLTENIAKIKSGFLPEELALKNTLGALTNII